MVVSELIRTPTMIVGTEGPIFVSVYLGSPVDGDYDALEQLQTQFSAKHPRFFSMSVVTVLTTDRRSMELAKTRGLPLAKRFAPQLGGAATVILPSGIAATVARSFTTAFNLMSGLKYPMKAFAEIPEAVRWCSELNEPTALIADPLRSAASIEAFSKSVK